MRMVVAIKLLYCFLCRRICVQQRHTHCAYYEKIIKKETGDRGDENKSAKIITTIEGLIFYGNFVTLMIDRGIFR